MPIRSRVDGSFAELAQHTCTHKKKKWTDQETKRSYRAAHEKLAGRKLPDGKWATESSQHYSDSLNEKLASCVATALVGWKGDPAAAGPVEAPEFPPRPPS